MSAVSTGPRYAVTSLVCFRDARDAQYSRKFSRHRLEVCPSSPHLPSPSARSLRRTGRRRARVWEGGT
jgi:hypothetical protein